MYKNVLVAYDGSALSDKALDEAIALAQQGACRVSLLYVLAPHHLMMGTRTAPGLKELEKQHMDTLRQQAREMLAGAHLRLKAAKIESDVILEEGTSPYQQIIETAKRLKSDLIMMASHGRRGLEALWVGSQATKVIANAPVPVLVVR